MDSGLKLIEHVFLWLNKGVYWLAEKVYGLFLDIANLEILTPDTIATFGQRIYVLLGIIMLFKLSFSFINYILNPDDFVAKEKGVGKIIIHVIVVLILLVTTPFIFEQAMVLQKKILSSNIIPSLILGMGVEDGTVVKYGREGEMMSFLVFSTFYQPNPAIFVNSEDSEEDLDSCQTNLFVVSEEDATDESEDEVVFKMDDKCANVLNAATGTSFDGQIAELYSLAYENYNLNILTDTDLNKARSEINGDKVDTFNVNGFIALVAGILLCWILFMFCFDIAVRAVKLIFLQIVAPIPIIAYADPKSSKVFMQWLKVSLSTYLDLFIRLVAIFFAIFVIQLVVHNYFGKGVNPLVIIFIIFGALLFTRQLPKLISDITGAKMDGKFSMRPIKKMQEMPLLGAGMTSLGARAAGGWEAMRNDQTGHKFRSFLEGGSAAAQANHGKVPLMGLNPNANPIRAINEGRKTGYKYSTGSEMRSYSPINRLFGGSAKEEYEKLDEDKKGAKQKVSNAQSNMRRLNAQYEQAQRENRPRAVMDNISNKIDENQKVIAKGEKYIKSIEDQQNQIQSRYPSFDPVTNETIIQNDNDFNEVYDKIGKYQYNESDLPKLKSEKEASSVLVTPDQVSFEEALRNRKDR